MQSGLRKVHACTLHAVHMNRAAQQTTLPRKEPGCVVHCTAVMRMASGGRAGCRGSQVHFRSFPVGRLLRWEGEASLRAAFYNSLKARGPRSVQNICQRPTVSLRARAGRTLQEKVWSARPQLQPPEAGLLPRALMCGPAGGYSWCTRRTGETDARRHSHSENTTPDTAGGSSKHVPVRSRWRDGHGDHGGERAVVGGGVPTTC